MVVDRIAEWKTDDDLLGVVVVDVDLIYLHMDDLDDVGWASGVDDPRTLDIHPGSRSLDILSDDAPWLMNLAN